MTHGAGCYVFDSQGKRYLEAMAGLWCTSLGFSNKRLIDAATAEYGNFGFYHTFNHKTPDVTIELAEELVRISPVPNARAFFATSGSEATETMVKLSWVYHAARGKPGKRKIIARDRAFHGSTIVSASMCGLSRMQREFGLPLPGFLHTLCPDAYHGRLEGETEDAFTDRLAAELERLILSVGMKPDMMALAKGISSSYFPISAVILSEAVHEALAEFNKDGELFGHGFTNSGHPVGAAVSLEALRIYHEMDVVAHVRKMGQRLRDGLQSASVGSRIVGQIRGAGLMIGVELVADPATHAPFPPALRVGAMFDEQAMANGLIIRPMGDIIGFSPPLIVGEYEVDEMAALFGKTLAEVESRIATPHTASSAG
jgi:4-aminobutyrate--pyruvate transaminase